MAFYQYKCIKCDKDIVIQKPMKEATREEKCEVCESILKRVYDATNNQWKCNGAYVTDSK